MRVVIVGAGSVGYAAAETIAGIHDVLVIESDSAMAEKVKNSLDVSVLHEDGSNPRVLKEAIQKHSAEAIVSTLKNDAVNLFICMVSKRFAPKIKTVASINDPDYRIELEAEGYNGVDMIVSPEMVTARKMYKMAVLENARDFEYLDTLGACVAVFQVRPEHKIVGQVVLGFRLPAECTVFGIYREGTVKLDVDIMEIRAGDGICVFGSEAGLEAFNDMMGVEAKAVEFIILGGSIVGMNLAKLLLGDKVKRFVTIVESNQERCREITRMVPEAMVINEDYKDPGVQRSEDLFKADCLLVTSGSDDTNLLMCMSAERHRARKVVTRYFKPEYKDIFAYTGLETFVGYHEIVSNEITRCVLPDDLALMRMRNHNETMFLHTVTKRSVFCNSYLGDVRLPAGVRIVAVLRKEEGSRRIIYCDLDTYVREEDDLVVFTCLARDSDFKKLFGKDALPEL